MSCHSLLAQVLSLRCRSSIAFSLRIMQIMRTKHSSPIKGFQASDAIYMRSALFWVIMQRSVVFLYQRFRITCRSRLQGSKSPRLLKMGPIGYREMSIQKYHSTLCNIPQGRRSHKRSFLHGYMINNIYLFIFIKLV